jgi:hypothetical protein
LPITVGRTPTFTLHPLANLFRQSVDSRLTGYKEVNAAEGLPQHPAFRLIGSKKT